MLWREGEHDLGDLLVEIARDGLTPWFTTNGNGYLDCKLSSDHRSGLCT